MAGFNISISYSLRPCFVHINESDRKKALFHRWADFAQVSNPILQGDVGGQLWSVLAIVEYEDGTVATVPCSSIEFVDQKVSEYHYPEEVRK